MLNLFLLCIYHHPCNHHAKNTKSKARQITPQPKTPKILLFFSLPPPLPFFYFLFFSFTGNYIHYLPGGADRAYNYLLFFI